MHKFEQYWLFATFCFVIIGLLLRLVLRERITLQSSLWLLLLLVGLFVLSVFPGLTGKLAHAMGFVLPSNFFFAMAVSALLLSHVHTLVTLSRTELRSITLTQEIALLRERLDRSPQLASSPTDGGCALVPRGHDGADGLS